jgi:competence protein ComEA
MKHGQTCIKTFGIMLLLLCAALPAMAEPAAVQQPASKAALQGTVNINTADASQLTLLPGIGPKAADSIIAYRGTNGAFASVDDLVKVKGIGPKTLEKLRPYLSVKGESTLKKTKKS